MVDRCAVVRICSGRAHVFLFAGYNVIGNFVWLHCHRGAGPFFVVSISHYTSKEMVSHLSMLQKTTRVSV